METSVLTRSERTRIEALVEALIALLDASDFDSEDRPAFPGHPAYREPPASWRDSPACWHSGLDADSEENGDEQEPNWATF